jgi:hypothetical protein
MVPLASLWLPIVVSAAAVFVASLTICMAIHRNDWRKAPNEDALLDLVRGKGVPAGQYMVPGCTPADLKDPAKKARFDQGPVGFLRVSAGPFHMGKMLGLWFLHVLIVALVVGYVAHLALPAGASTMNVFRLTSVTALLAYVAGAMPSVVWEGKPIGVALKSHFDGIVHVLATGGVFVWLWPHGA